MAARPVCCPLPEASQRERPKPYFNTKASGKHEAKNSLTDCPRWRNFTLQTDPWKSALAQLRDSGDLVHSQFRHNDVMISAT